MPDPLTPPALSPPLGPSPSAPPPLPHLLEQPEKHSRTAASQQEHSSSSSSSSRGPLEARLQAINKMATITRSQRAQLSLTASSLALDLQRLELACAFLLTDRLWAVAIADLAQLAVGLHANTAQRRLITTPSALYSHRPTSLNPTASGPTAMGGQQQ
ncbi:hypothetical protein V8C86DRAFT_3090675 [Haematococcus lacustris]